MDYHKKEQTTRIFLTRGFPLIWKLQQKKEITVNNLKHN